MARNIISRIVTILLVLTFYISFMPAQALADSSTAQNQVIKFYLDPALVPDMNFAKLVLPKYVADMNIVLAKNTTRRLVFDSESGIIITSTKPQTDSASLPLPTEGFDIWAHAVQTNNTISYGGYASMDKSGAGVLAGLKWTRLYDPDNLTTSQVTDYTLQLDHMLHELAHVFGAGIGEYYNLSSVDDITGLEPLLNIRLADPTDSFWSTKLDFMTDPLLRFTSVSTRAGYLSAVQYSNLTASIINGSYRNGMPSFDHYTIQILDHNNAPVAGANVKVWNVKGGTSNMSDLLFDGVSNENGQVILSWGGSSSTHNASNFLRLIKAYKDGLPIAQPNYFSIFDADSLMLVSHENSITVTLKPTQPKIETFVSSGKNDGWILESTQGSQMGGFLNTNAGVFLLGDDTINRQYRSVLSFNTTSLPEDAIITRVTLKILQQTTIGVDPISTHGNLQVDINQVFFGTKAGLQKVDFQAAPSQANTGIRTTKTADSWYNIELNDQAYALINRAGISQLRLQFDLANNGDGTADIIKFFSGNATNLTKRPQLVIEYYVA